MIRLLWPLSIGAFALGLDAYVLAGLLPAMATDLHTTQAAVGLGVAVFTAAYAISAPIFASFSAKYSMRTLLLSGLGFFILGNVITMISPSLWVLLVARLIAGIGAGLYSPQASSCAANTVDTSKKGKALSFILAGLSMGTALGVPVGLWIEQWLSWRWTIGLIMALSIISAIGISRRSASFPPLISISWHDRFVSLKTPFTTLTLLVTLWTAIASFGLYTYMAEISVSRNFGKYVPEIIWLWGLGGMIGSLLIGRVLDKYLSPLRASLVLLSTFALGIVLFAYGTLPIAMVGSFLWGLASWASVAPQQYALVTHAPKHAASLIAWNSSINYMGGAIGATIGSAALSASLPPQWLPAGFLIAMAIAVTLHVWKSLISEHHFNTIQSK
ncbi:MFS transporter [Brenneria goodwinii]|uniref:MFS transporter n=1 Tax=Brenneria goodwinii TaxID=1109412 RepID=UPI0036F16B4B